MHRHASMTQEVVGSDQVVAGVLGSRSVERKGGRERVKRAKEKSEGLSPFRAPTPPPHLFSFVRFARSRSPAFPASPLTESQGQDDQVIQVHINCSSILKFCLSKDALIFFGKSNLNR